MKVLQAGLQNNVVTSYDKTKTYLAGRAFQKTLNSQLVVGPPLTNFIDFQTDLGFAPTLCQLTTNGRLFAVQAPAATGIAVIGLYDFDMTGQVAPAFIGKINVLLGTSAATTHTLRMLKIDDGANAGVVTGWKIFLGTTGSVLINGGTYLANNIAKADFSVVSAPTIPLGITSNAKASYLLQDPANIGVNNNLTQLLGGAINQTGVLLYSHNGVVATHQYIKWDYSVAPSVVLQTTTSPTVNGSPTFTLTAHGYNANDPVVITSNAPTGFTASTGLVNTVYFVRNPAANTFELSATTGGASINATSVTSATVIARAFGATSSLFSLKTGNLTGFVGAFLANNSENLAVPSTTLDPNIPVGLNGVNTIFNATASNFYLFKESEITNGATTLPSLSTVNVSGSGSDFTAVAPLNAVYSTTVGRVIFVSNVSTFYIKKWQNSVIDAAFGGLQTAFLEGAHAQTCNFAGVAVANLEQRSGWVLLASVTIGQRGVFYMDLRSDTAFKYTFITSPVLSTPGSVLRFLNTAEQLFDLTNSLIFSYKTAATSTDAVFNDPTTGWVASMTAKDLNTALQAFTQIRIDFDIANFFVDTPSQVNEIFVSLQANTEISEKWEGSVDGTSANGVSPAYTAFRQIISDSGTKYFKAYDDSGNLIVAANTSANFASFDKTANDGTSWAAMTGANDYGTTPLLTGVRYKWLSPPGVKVTCTLSDNP